MRLLMLVPVAAAALFAQTPAAIDNDQVRVVTAHDQPHVKGRLHEHKPDRVMVYLQAGSQEMITAAGKKTTLTWNAGDVRWSPGGGMHTSEITSDVPVAIVEVEMKKPGDPSKKITTPLDPLKVDPKAYTLEFENSQVRVVRVRFPAHASAAMHEHQLNRVVIYLTDQNTRLTTAEGKTDISVHKAGEASWGGPAKHKEENLMDGPFEALVVDLKN